MGELYLKIPVLEELIYRKKYVSDPNTMDYNQGYDMELEGYDKETGTITFDEEKWTRWYDKWINNRPYRYFAYIMRKSDQCVMGEVAFRLDEETGEYIVNVILDSKYRGMGYSEEALRLLIDVAFYEYNLNRVVNEIPKKRIAAIKLFQKIGFQDRGDDLYEVRWGKEEKVEFLELTKEEYEKVLKKDETIVNPK